MQAVAGVCRCVSPHVPHHAAMSTPRASPRLARLQQPRTSRLVATNAIKAVESYDASFTLDTTAQELLFALLRSEVFTKQVKEQCKIPEGTRVEFTEMLFQPVPWSPTTKRGMPAHFERYLDDPSYIVINVPPNFIFKAKIFKPSRLCAIYKRMS